MIEFSVPMAHPLNMQRYTTYVNVFCIGLWDHDPYIALYLSPAPQDGELDWYTYTTYTNHTAKHVFHLNHLSITNFNFTNYQR